MNVSNGFGQVAAAEPVTKSQPVEAAHAAASSQAGKAQGSTIQDQVQLSSASELVAAALRTSDVRTSKVEQLQTAIGAGTYNVSSSLVADSVIGALTGTGSGSLTGTGAGSGS